MLPLRRFSDENICHTAMATPLSGSRRDQCGTSVCGQRPPSGTSLRKSSVSLSLRSSGTDSASSSARTNRRSWATSRVPSGSALG